MRDSERDISKLFFQAMLMTNYELTQKEQFAADRIIFPQLKRIREGEPACPFIGTILGKPGTEEPYFILLYIVPYVDDLTSQLLYDYIRVVRMSQDDYLDFLLVAGELVEPNLTAQCH